MDWSLNSLVWCSELLMPCFGLSFYPSSQSSPLGTLFSCHLEPYTVLPSVDWFVPTDYNSLVLLLYGASFYSAFKAPVKCHLLWEAFSDLTSAAPAASFSGFSWHLKSQLYVILSVIDVPQLLQAGDLGVPSLWLITCICVWHVVGSHGIWVEWIFPWNSDLQFLTNHLDVEKKWELTWKY